MKEEKWIFDNDGGLDDTYALVLLLSKPEIKLECITIVGGNVPADVAAKATVRTLEVCNIKIPVYVGANEGIIQPANYIFDIHGNDGQGDAPEYKDLIGYKDCIKPDIHAVQALIKTINENVGKISILATGPLTNIALALKLDPEIPKKLKRFVVMGGAYHAIGNSSWTAEFNFHCDPEAADICIRSIPFIEILTVEDGNNFIPAAEDIKKWLNPEKPRGKFLHCISKAIMDNPNFSRVYCYDALAAAMVVDPTVVKNGLKARCKIELHGTETRGTLAINWKGRKDYNDKDILPRIVLDIHYEAAIKLLISSTNL